ncbi:PEP-CTERM sorting domain-containing protein [Methylophilus sp. 5]|uniref:PEP-CTERM sorting domain-containing protein n=1 Tax=Methylophilus sp. 5 TaxID=1112274 RepID=UPI00048F808A|nr:PEP-CTERM sorting domain-containing protein [Methylophilus sp. 5]
MRFLKQRSIALSVFVGLFSTSVLADTLDFTTLSQGPQGSTVLVFPQATITSFGADFYIGASGIASEICPLTTSTNCQADMQVDFTSAVNSLSFVLAGYDSGDHLDINIFSGATLLGTIASEANGLVDLSAYSNITKLYFDDSSTGAGFSYDKFQFTVANVPEPETYGMLLAGLGLLGFATRRKQA